MKKCICCGVEKPLTEFHKRANGSLRNDCKQCKNASNRKNYETNKEARTQQIREWRNNNKELVRSYDNNLRHKRRVAKNAVDMSELDFFVFQEAHKLCALRKEVTGYDWHVDHIVPINHKQACGLHNAFNFQVVPAVWNIKKSNRNMNKFIGN
jgi:hypothetical protein